MIEKISSNELTLAFVLRADLKETVGTEFLTPDNLNLQLAQMKFSKGHSIAPHIHKNVVRNIEGTAEALIIKSGKVRVNFYDLSKNFIRDTVISAGDIILLFQGGHGFEVIEDSEFYEIKQGPFLGTGVDKEKFEVNHG